MAAALTLGLRGHHVIVLEAAPKVCIVENPRYIKQD